MSQVARPIVFTSFDFEHDDGLRTLLVGQSRNPRTPFEIVDWSLKEALPGDWKAKVRDRIRRVDIVIVLCGEHTDMASGVSAEVQIAREEEKPCYFLRGHPDRVCQLPKAALPSDQMLNWTWENLAAILGGQVDSSETGTLSFREWVLVVGVAGLLYLGWRAWESKRRMHSPYTRPPQPPIRWL